MNKAGSNLFLLLFFIVLSVVINQWVPPLQSPDENAHIARGYAISQGQLFLSASENKNSGVYIDENLVKFIHKNMSLIKNPGLGKNRINQKENNKLTNWSNNEIYYPSPGTGYYAPFIYLPQSIGWRIGRSADLSIEKTYELVRLISLITALLIFFTACKLYLPNIAVVSLFLLPMSMFQIFMPSIDGICHSITILILCWFSKLSTQNYITKNSILEKKVFDLPIKYILFCLTICFLTTARLQAASFLLFILFLPSFLKIRVKIFLFFISTVIVGSWVIYGSISTSDLRIDRGLTTGQVFHFYVNNPQEWWNKLYLTISSYTLWYKYFQSFIGILGWLQIRLIDWYYNVVVFLLAGFLGYSIYTHRNTFNKNQFFLMLGISIISVFIIFNALLFTWTPIANPTIEGVQGRYFWIPLCCLVFGIGGGKSYNFIAKFALFCFLIFNFLIIWYAYARYYH